MITIVDATKNNIEQLISFGKESFVHTFENYFDQKDLADYLVEGYNTSVYEQWIERDDHHIFVAFEGETVVGYAIVSPCRIPLENCGLDASYASTCGEIKRIYIHHSQFGSGLGQKLMTVSLNWLKDRNYCDRIYLDVFPSNMRAQNFYLRNGFENVGEYEFELGSKPARAFIFKLQANN